MPQPRPPSAEPPEPTRRRNSRSKGAGLSRRGNDRVEGRVELKSPLVIRRGSGACSGRAEQRDQVMTAGTGFPDKKVIAELTAKMLLEVDAVRFMADRPFIFTSGWSSPVYTDCRRLISFPRVRATLIDFATATIMREAGFEQFDAIAGGETAGIPFAAWIAERLGLPMLYVRKQPKGFGRNAQIEGDLKEGQRVLLVEDLATDGGSKLNFVKALKTAGAKVAHTFVVFHYGIFPQSVESLKAEGVALHGLATWWTMLEAAERRGYGAGALAEVRSFLNDPNAWSKARGGKADG